MIGSEAVTTAPDPARQSSVATEATAGRLAGGEDQRRLTSAATPIGEAMPGRRDFTYFLPYQQEWILDKARLRICQKGRQIGMSYADSYDSVKKASVKGGLDVWVMSRDEIQAKQYIQYCKKWAKLLNQAFADLGEQMLSTQDGKAVKVQVITFASGASIYALSSNPDAIVGKTGHVKLDEFALAKDQRILYAVAKPVIQWGGTLSVISTHRGVQTVFNELITDIQERGNKMGWSLHTIPIQRAVADGIVERIDLATGGGISKRRSAETPLREFWMAEARAECIDEEQWQQEYCCVPADESTAFISYEMIRMCEDDAARKDFAYLKACTNPLFIGFDVARTVDLSVIDIEEKVGDVFWERMRIEMRGKTYAEQEFELYRLLALPAVRRACIDASGLGGQLAERAKEKFGYRVEGIKFTAQIKEDLAFPLRRAHEDRNLRYNRDEKLQGDLRGIRKEVTASGNIRFAGEAKDSHCDRFWAKALAYYAGNGKQEVWAMVG